MVDFMEEMKWLYLRCEMCKNIELVEIEKKKEYVSNAINYQNPFHYFYCPICEKMTLHIVLGYDI